MIPLLRMVSKCCHAVQPRLCLTSTADQLDYPRIRRADIFFVQNLSLIK